MTKISYVTITARSDFPTQGLPNLHLWEPTLKTLEGQTFKDFEWIIVDVFYEERKDYFKPFCANHGLKIKHIPAAPNIWTQYGLVQTCHQFNKGIIHADGELLFFDADSGMLHPNLMENLWQHYKDGYFVSLGFGCDVTYAPEIQERQQTAEGVYESHKGEWQQASVSEASATIVPTDWIKDLGYGYQGKVIMDHRYRKLFAKGSSAILDKLSSIESSKIPSQWYYGISTASMEAMLKVNGFNLAFDGDSALNDVDLGNRLVMAGYDNLMMFRDSYCIEAYAGSFWHPKMRRQRPEVKCNYGMVLYNKLSGRYRANEPLSNADLDYIINKVCADKCEVRKTCKTLPHRGPFFNKNEPELFVHWKKYGMSEAQDLELEREMRKSGEMEKEGTFVNI
jgi:hypothetical protein